MSEKKIVKPVTPPKLLFPPGTKLPQVSPEKIVKDNASPPQRALFISDIHFGVQNDKALATFLAFARDAKPDLIVVNGDVYDFWGISRFDKEVERWRKFGSLLKEEFKLGAPFWKAICEIAPRVEYIKGNHESRWDRLVNANPALFDLIDWHALGEIPKNVKIHEFESRVNFGGVWAEHGHKIPSGVKHKTEWLLNNRPGQNTVVGHWHLSALSHRATPTEQGNKLFFAHVLGHMSDVKKQSYTGGIANWSEGFLYIEYYKIGNKINFTPYPVTLINNRFCFGGTLYHPNM